MAGLQILRYHPLGAGMTRQTSKFLGNVSVILTLFTQISTHEEMETENSNSTPGSNFDPTADFHNSTIHWNPTEVGWYVDSLPIRVFRNNQNEGFPYPNQQGMRVYSSLWNADNWVTRGELVKINWDSAPFIARYRHFRARACKWNWPVSISQCATRNAANWWTSPTYSQLSYAKQDLMKWVRHNYMIHNYC